MKKNALINNTHGLYMCENILLYPGQNGVIKLSFPRCFIRYNSREGYFTTFEEWANHIIVLDWLDPKDKPTSQKEIDNILTDIWNFIALSEEEEERLFELNNGYELDEDEL